MTASPWSTGDIGDRSGTRAVVTGATGGLGYQVALQLARHGAEVVVTARTDDKAREVVSRLHAVAPGATLASVTMNLADLSSVRYAARTVLDRYDRVDVCVNNAGLMAAPFRRSADGFELHLATNHLGHFAWTAGLWPVLAASDARVVSVSSLLHTRAAGIDLRALTTTGAPRRYRRWRSYAESKLANLCFALELDRRVRAAGLGVTSVAAHPGYAATSLTESGPALGGRAPWSVAMHQVTQAFGQSATAGSWPLLMAATLPNLAGGSYVGPGGPMQVRGRPQRVGMSRAARDELLARDLWEASEAAIGTRFDVGGTP